MIGAGSAGIAAAKHAAMSGAKTCLVEQGMVGGRRVHSGGVPVTAFLHAANMYNQARNAQEFGVTCADVKVSFPKLMERMRKVRAEVSNNTSVQMIQNIHGVDVFFGSASFTGKN